MAVARSRAKTSGDKSKGDRRVPPGRTVPPVATSAEARRRLVEELKLDLVGPGPGHPLENEELRRREAPARWYLTGFLVPLGAGDKLRFDVESDDDIGGADTADGGDDDQRQEKAAAKKVFLPSSMGLSVLVPPATTELTAEVRWGHYDLVAAPQSAGESASAEAGPDAGKAHERVGQSDEGGSDEGDHGPAQVWRRRQEVRRIPVRVDGGTLHAGPAHRIPVPDSDGLELYVLSRVIDSIGTDGAEGDDGNRAATATTSSAASSLSGLSPGTRALSIFLLNQRTAAEFSPEEAAIAFQVELELECPEGFVARPDIHGEHTDDPDEKTADLQYRDVTELAVGHGVAAEAEVVDGRCGRVKTAWLPTSTVYRVEPRARIVASTPSGDLALEQSPEALAKLATGEDVERALGALPLAYEAWVSEQLNGAQAELASTPERMTHATRLLKQARNANKRIAKGIQRLVEDPVARRAFALANEAMAMAGRQRNAILAGKRPDEVSPHPWRPFQLAFILLSLEGVAEPTSPDRQLVDLLFFPTGGGKTEAYLGLAAFTLILRRLRHPGAYRGVTVLMRYTLRLLTLDQLGRAAGLVCALELMRQQDPGELGSEPFEIGLWVGSAATPNRMGSKENNYEWTARRKTLAYHANSRAPMPVPIESCPWCGTRFEPASFKLLPNDVYPTDLRLLCPGRDCRFTRGNYLPIVTVDEPLYQRLPCFIIATVDKFASLPWWAEAGPLLGSSPLQKAKKGVVDIRPPDLIIQDELHLISGPLGTVVGLYETALDALSERVSDTPDGPRSVRPKVVASTATVRRADKQVQALFARTATTLFPPPGPDRRDSFFATESTDLETGRLYLGVAAQGRSQKVVLLRTLLSLLSASKALHDATGKVGAESPVDPYMTVLGYFNALRELGGSRRIVEDEVRGRLRNYSRRRRLNDAEARLADRQIEYDVAELTSRESTSDVARAKAALANAYGVAGSVDVALATNMISVGLDIPRLGLMVALGQPKSTAEYIQATSRVGRESKKPGLVVTLLNIHRPRDRSHFERFGFYHATFYRAVEATSVTPFSARALDRALPAVVVAMARHHFPELTASLGANELPKHRTDVERYLVEVLSARGRRHKDLSPDEQASLEASLQNRVSHLLDVWSASAADTSSRLKYSGFEPPKGGGDNVVALLRNVLAEEQLSEQEREFVAAWSMRGVEPEIPVFVMRLEDGRDLEEGQF